MSVTTFCLDCDHSLDLGSELEVGRRVRCPCCQVELEVINLDPLELDWIYERNNHQLDILSVEEREGNV